MSSLFRKIIDKISKKVNDKYSICYTQRQNEGHAAFGNCSGVVGGTSATEYLSESCIDCPYLWKER